MRRFAFRSVQAEGYDAANILTAMAQVATHRYGGRDFDAFLTPIMQNNTTAISQVAFGNKVKDTAKVYDLNGRSISNSNANRGLYIVKQGGNTRKIVSNGK